MSSSQIRHRKLATAPPFDKRLAEFLEQINQMIGSPTADQLVEADWREQTQENYIEARRIRDARRKHLEDTLEDYRRESNLRTVSTLLRDLQVERGMMWVDIAKMIGVSVPALRKWRQEIGGPSKENLAKLSTLVAFLNTLEEIHVPHPAAWISLPILKDFSATPSDLYCEGSFAFLPLLDFAAQNIKAQDLLDEVDSTWRAKYHSEFETYLAADGHMSLRRREIM